MEPPSEPALEPALEPVLEHRSPLRGATLTRTAGKSGYLVKEPIDGYFFSRPRRRFFCLSESKLDWFLDDKSVAIRGTLQLAGARVELSSELRNNALVIISRAGERLVLRGEALDEWAAAIQEQLE